MKKFLKFLLFFLSVALAFFIILLFVTDSRIQQKSSVEINAPAEKVWPKLRSMKDINSWIPWMQNNSEMVERYEGKSGEVGDTFVWQKK